jgi:hypothetical protein
MCRRVLPPCFHLAARTLLKQAERSTSATYGFLLLKRQLRELESIAVTCAITHDTSDSNWGRCNRNRKLQAHRRANVPSGGKYPRDSAFIDVQRTPSHHTAFDPRMLALNSVSISYLGYRRLVAGISDCWLPPIGPRLFFYSVVL